MVAPATEPSYRYNLRGFSAIEKEAQALLSNGFALRTICKTDKLGDQGTLIAAVKALQTDVENLRNKDILKDREFEVFTIRLTSIKPLLKGIIDVSSNTLSPGVLSKEKDLALRCHGIGIRLLSTFEIVVKDVETSNFPREYDPSLQPTALCDKILENNININTYYYNDLQSPLRKAALDKDLNALNNLEVLYKAGLEHGDGMGGTPLRSLLRDFSHASGLDNVVQMLISFGEHPDVLGSVSSHLLSEMVYRGFNLCNSTYSILLDGGMETITTSSERRLYSYINSSYEFIRLGAVRESPSLDILKSYNIWFLSDPMVLRYFESACTMRQQMLWSTEEPAKITETLAKNGELQNPITSIDVISIIAQYAFSKFSVIFLSIMEKIDAKMEADKKNARSVQLESIASSSSEQSSTMSSSSSAQLTTPQT